MSLHVFFDHAVDSGLLQYAVIVSRTADGRWVFCRHKNRNTWECPGGHIEPGETAEAAARRELWEETGATAYQLTPVDIYGVSKDGQASYGMLFSAVIDVFGPLPPLEIAEVRPFDQLPKQWTYPDIQPILLRRAARALGIDDPFKEV